MDTHPSSSTLLSAAEFARFESYILEIAREAKGAGTLASDGPYRFGAKQGLCVYLNGQFHDFSGGPRPHGHGALELVQHLYPNEDPIAWAIAWLAQHPGNGAFIPWEGEPGDDFKEVEATAYITALYTGAALIDGTPSTTRGLPLLPEDQAKLRWVANYRGEEGLLVFPVTDDESKLVKLLGIHITPDAGKSPHPPARITILGAKRRGLLRFGAPGPNVVEAEGPEKGLAARAVGTKFVVVVGGVSNFGKAALPPGAQSVVIVRDEDPPGSSPDVELWRGVSRRLKQGFKTAVTSRPNSIAPKEAPPLKDLDDLYRYDPEYVSIVIEGANLEHGRLGEAADEALYEEALRFTPGELGHAARGLMDLLRVSKGTLDAEVARRIKTRGGERSAGPRGALGPTPWEDPVTDIAAVLDASVRCMRKYVAAPDIYFDTVALWILHAHLIHREELGIDVTPRLGFQSPEEDSGKTTFMKTVREQVPRPKGTGSLSSSALFRAVHDRKVTFLVDEGDMVFHPNASPDLFAIFNSSNDRAFASVTRSVPLGDGQFEDQDFNTFGALCFTSIDKLWLRSSQSRCIGLPMRPATQQEAAGLVRFRTNRDQELKDCGRKLARWAMDLPELPDIDVPDNFVNRIADNWRCLFQIAHAAGGDWPARILAAAQADADGYGDSEGRAERGANGLLDAIWRVFAAETTDPRRLHTEVLIEKLLNLDDGRWRVANKGKAIDAYYFRTKLKNYITPQSKKADDSKEAEDKMPPREWRSPKGQNKNGYHELHFADPFRRYLGRGLPSEAGTDPSPLDPPSPSTSHASTTSTTWTVSVDKSKSYPVVDSVDDRGSASTTKREPNAVVDGHPRSSASSTTKKTEQIVGIEPSGVDVVDTWGTDREKVRTEVNAAGRLPRGPVGRKRQKG